jgi:hypothetical protein
MTNIDPAYFIWGALFGCAMWKFMAGAFADAREANEIRYHCMRLLEEVLDGTAEDMVLCQSSVLSTGMQVGWIRMVSVYQKYVNGLPLGKRIEIIDKLLGNQERKLDEPCKDLTELINHMSYVELETLIYCINDDHHIINEDGTVLKREVYRGRDLANDVLAFRLSNPY